MSQLVVEQLRGRYNILKKQLVGHVSRSGGLKMSATDDVQLLAKHESLVAEYQICRQKLDSKCEALLILSRELGECRSERDQFKLMAEQLRERYQVLKRQLAGHRPMSPSHDDSSSSVDLKEYATAQGQGLAQVLIEYREQNKSLQFEVDDLKQKLQDAQGDIKLLREQIVRSRVGTTDEGMTTRHFPAYEREDLVKQLEASRDQTVQLERDLQQVLDEKQELVTERDAYRHKYGRLNTELNYILKGDDKGVVDIDALIMENKYLQERLKQMEEEKAMAMDTASKYKSILEKKKNKGILKVGQNRSGGLIISQKQVQQMVQKNVVIPPTPQAMADLQSLCSALHDSVNDKSLALSHQRKTNKLLGNRVSELEKKLKTLEVTGLWSVSEHLSNLERLRQECSEVSMLVPVSQTPESSEASDQPREILSDLDSDSLNHTPSAGPSPTHGHFGPASSEACSSSAHNAFTSTSASLNSNHGLLSGLVGHDMEADLDLLPTKEEVVKHMGEEDHQSMTQEKGCHGNNPMKDLSLDCSATENGEDSNGDEESVLVIKNGIDEDDDEEGNNENDDEEDNETSPETETSCLLGDDLEDKETARQLQNFMESVTSKIRDRNLQNRGMTVLPVAGISASIKEDTENRVSAGMESQEPVNQSEGLTSPTRRELKQPLLQEMSEPSHSILGIDSNKSVEC